MSKHGTGQRPQGPEHSGKHGTEHRPQRTGSKIHDPYQRRRKPSDAVVCGDCGLVHHGGRWFRGAPPLADVHEARCPACERTRDRYPAGTIRVPADFLEQRDELLNMIRNAEQAESEEHPLERVMGMEDDPEGGLVVTTTGLHLARVIANKLERRFHRQAHLDYPENEYLLRVHWED